MQTLQAGLSQPACLPACRYIKPFILIQLAVTVVLAIVTVFSTLIQVCCCLAQLQLCLQGLHRLHCGLNCKCCCTLHCEGLQSVVSGHKGSTQSLAAPAPASLQHTQCSHCC